MTKNEGTIDRIVRAIVGSLLIAAAFMLEANGLTMLFYTVGVAAIIAASTGVCLFYKFFSISTVKE